MSFAIFEHVMNASASALLQLESRIKELSNEIMENADNERIAREEYQAGIDAAVGTEGNVKDAGDFTESYVVKVKDEAASTSTTTAYKDETRYKTVSFADWLENSTSAAAKNFNESEGASSIQMLELQKEVANWTIILGVATGLLKSLSDGLEGVGRNI